MAKFGKSDKVDKILPCSQNALLNNKLHSEQMEARKKNTRGAASSIDKCINVYDQRKTRQSQNLMELR